MTAALQAAQARIAADTDHANALAKELKDAKKKLAKLEASIAKAKRQAPSDQVVVVKTKTVTTSKPKSSRRTRTRTRATSTRAEMTETRRPVHLAVLVGVSAGAYAASLAGVTALQSATDARIAAERAPAKHAVDVMAGGADELETSLDAATHAYTVAAGRYARLAPQLTDMETSLDKLGKRVAEGHGRGERPARSREREPAAGLDVDADRHPHQGRPHDDGGLRLTVLDIQGDRRQATAGTPMGATASDSTRRYEARAMASPLRLTVCWSGRRAGRASTAADVAWAGVRAEFEAAEQAMSRFRETSDLTRLNGRPAPGAMSASPRRLERALVAADRAHRVTAGRFDPRVLRDLERLGYAGAPLATAVADPGLAGTRPERIVDRVGRRPVARGSRRSTSGASGRGSPSAGPRPSSSATASTRYLLEAGGDLVARGTSPDGGPWMVGIEDPAGDADAAGRDHRRGRGRRDLVGPAAVVGPRRPGRAPSHRSADRRAGGRAACARSRSPGPTRPGPRSGRRRSSSAGHREIAREARARGAGGLVGDRRRATSR